MEPAPATLVALTVVSNEVEAEMVCGLLRTEGIACQHAITDFAFGSGGELPQSGAGPRRITVHQHNLERARELLDAVSPGNGGTDSP